MYEHLFVQVREGVISPRAQVTGVCEPPDTSVFNH